MMRSGLCSSGQLCQLPENWQQGDAVAAYRFCCRRLVPCRPAPLLSAQAVQRQLDALAEMRDAAREAITQLQATVRDAQAATRDLQTQMQAALREAAQQSSRASQVGEGWRDLQCAAGTQSGRDSKERAPNSHQSPTRQPS